MQDATVASISLPKGRAWTNRGACLQPATWRTLPHILSLLSLFEAVSERQQAHRLSEQAVETSAFLIGRSLWTGWEVLAENIPARGGSSREDICYKSGAVGLCLC
jgi:hypothetical protein